MNSYYHRHGRAHVGPTHARTHGCMQTISSTTKPSAPKYTYAHTHARTIARTIAHACILSVNLRIINTILQQINTTLPMQIFFTRSLPIIYNRCSSSRNTNYLRMVLAEIVPVWSAVIHLLTSDDIIYLFIACSGVADCR